MKITEAIINKNLFSYLENKKVLEVACGDSYFSLAASKYAQKIVATDISLERAANLNLETLPDNIEFKEMDTSKLDLPDNSFDVAICYNALGHLKNLLEQTLKEMTRVVNKDGYLIFVATWSMDIDILSRLEIVIDNRNDLIVDSMIENNSCKILILRKAEAYAGK